MVVQGWWNWRSGRTWSSSPSTSRAVSSRAGKTLRRHYERLLGASWRDQPEMKKLLHDAHRGNMKRPSEAASADLLAMVAFYEHHVAQSLRNKVLDAQVRTFRHNREHLPEDHRQPAAGALDADLGRPWVAACRPTRSTPTMRARS